MQTLDLLVLCVDPIWVPDATKAAPSVPSSARQRRENKEWMGTAGQNRVNRTKPGGLDLLFAHTCRTPGQTLQDFYFLYTNIQDISLLPEVQHRDSGEQNNCLENTLFLKASEKKAAQGVCLEIHS